MSTSLDPGNIADVLRQLVALAGDNSAEEAPAMDAGDQPEGTKGKASETEKVESANPMSCISP
jgi:hypothetical protein